MKRKKKSVILLSVILFIISFIILLIFGKTYTAKIEVGKNIKNINELNIEIEQEKGIIKCTEKSLDDGILTLKMESLQKGKATIVIEGNDFYDIKRVYVHEFGILTYDNFFGKCNGDRIIPISIAILSIYIIYLLIKSFRYHLKENIYQYKNVTYLSLIIFLCFNTLNQIVTIIDYNGAIQTIDKTIETCSMISFVLFPIAIILSIIIAISNFILIKKEGLNWRNVLGIVLSLVLCIGTIIPNILNDLLQNSTIIDVHNESSFALYLEVFIETSIISVIAYLECIIIGTINIGIKSAKSIPNFDKDYMVILGCQIRKDGTLTRLLKSRVDRAIEFKKMQKEKSGKDLVLIPSGGKGNDEIISEAEAMKNYLLEKNIEENSIITEEKSTNTFENFKYSKEIIKQQNPNAKISFSTTNYHVFRAGIIANSKNEKIEGIGAKTKSYFWINAFIREFIATLNSQRKNNFAIISIVNISIIIMVVIKYYSNIL